MVKASMPINKESFYPAEWLKKAEVDLKRVSARLGEGDVEDAAFHLQQAIEKALKSFLLSQGWNLKRVHDLEVLLDDAVRYDDSFEQFRPLAQQVTGYYLVERYPAFEEGPSAKEVRHAYQHVQPLFMKIRRLIRSRKC